MKRTTLTIWKPFSKILKLWQEEVETCYIFPKQGKVTNQIMYLILSERQLRKISLDTCKQLYHQAEDEIVLLKHNYKNQVEPPTHYLEEMSSLNDENGKEKVAHQMEELGKENQFIVQNGNGTFPPDMTLFQQHCGFDGTEYSLFGDDF